MNASCSARVCDEGPIVLAINSNMLSVALQRKCFGSSQRHALLLELYLPIPPRTRTSPITMHGGAEGYDVHVNSVGSTMKEVKEEVEVSDVFLLKFDGATLGGDVF